MVRMRSMTPSSGTLAVTASHLSSTSGLAPNLVRKSAIRVGASAVQELALADRAASRSVMLRAS